MLYIKKINGFNRYICYIFTSNIFEIFGKVYKLNSGIQMVLSYTYYINYGLGKIHSPLSMHIIL